MQLQTLIDSMERIAPLKYAETWDNVGLLIGDPKQEVEGVMLCIDYTFVVAEEAKAANCNVIIAYHPPIFSPLERITSNHLIFNTIKEGIAIYSPHTALDTVKGGVNDVLADILDLQDRLPLRPTQIASHYLKLITFVPEEALEKLEHALFSAGAGHIGNYSHCSFRASGTGTFLGEEGTNPAIGKSGMLEKTPEIRFETILPINRISDVMNALYKNHPYEEPAYDLINVTAIPHGIGQGRIGNLKQATSCMEIIKQIKQGLDIHSVLVSGSTEGLITRIACLAGAGGGFIDDAIAQSAQLYITGEIKHHDAIKANQANIPVICTLHSNSERIIFKPLMQQLMKYHPKTKFQLARTDTDPLKII